MYMVDIPSYESFLKIAPINKGMSGDKKFYIETKDEKHRLLRIADISQYEQKKLEYEHMKKIYAKGVPMPQAISFGICNKGKSVYTLLEWIDGREVEEIIKTLSKKEKYDLGFKSGQILKLIHSVDTMEHMDDWYNRYFAVIDERIEAFLEEGVKFPGNEKILKFLKDNRELLKGRPQCHHHGDYHMGNMIITKDNKLFIIDWHCVDFNNYGDPWYEFNRIGIEYPAFAKGQIDGYFNNNVPNDFWILLAYYFSASYITSIVWAKYFAPERLKPILKLNDDILKWYDGMTILIPSWYRNNV